AEAVVDVGAFVVQLGAVFGGHGRQQTQRVPLAAVGVVVVAEGAVGEPGAVRGVGLAERILVVVELVHGVGGHGGAVGEAVEVVVHDGQLAAGVGRVPRLVQRHLR